MAALLFNSLSLLREVCSIITAHIRLVLLGLTSAPTQHLVLTGADIGARVVLIVGDIHGCYDELLDLVAAAKEAAHGAEIYLVCGGDMLNKGPKSLEVLLYLKDLMRQGKAAAVKGNHEEAILQQYSNLCKDSNYSLPKKYQYLKDFSDEDFAFLQQLPYSISIPHLNALVVHAGLLPGIPLHRQSLYNLCQMRNVENAVSLPWGQVATAIRKPTHGVPWASTWKGPQHVYFGHDCRRGLQQLPMATGLDTGCVYGKTLTGVLFHNMKIKPKLLSVTAKRQYYFGKQAEPS
ncbi:Bis(5'-nucleosyl)-tetraphosphatase, symmetrical [Plakobranchus ocellatus]|uniref:Bis(5'-nucleosyl)-tetraphosphatase, symmetrical n=1 Tax=Plakobranchus ocellatus TaxID=259542 RepID=A0AAV4D179_9GAST|nr:Bis(5'-nucleosyl)-tetraphosphatase, symmetrical [Plakobranchus ocellatus]